MKTRIDWQLYGDCSYLDLHFNLALMLCHQCIIVSKLKAELVGLAWKPVKNMSKCVYMEKVSLCASTVRKTRQYRNLYIYYAYVTLTSTAAPHYNVSWQV